MDFVSYFDGLMLSDGCIYKQKRGLNYCYMQTASFKNEGWLEDISFIFTGEGFIVPEFNFSPSKRGSWNEKTNGTYLFHTYTDKFFTEQHERWYIKEYDIDNYPKRLWHQDKEHEEDWYVWLKHVPGNIKLTSDCIANWYMGDGWLGFRVNRGYSTRYYYIGLATMSFKKDDINFLSELLYDCIDVRCVISSRDCIYISNKKDVSKFLDYVQPHIVPCFSYKLIGG